MIKTMRTLYAAKAFDVLAASPLIVWYAITVSGIAIKNVRALSSTQPDHTVHLLLGASAEIVTALFLGLQIVLFLIRKLPTAKATGLRPRLAGFAGANLPLLYLIIPRASIAPSIEVLSTATIVLATFLSVVVVIKLGRAFSILPQARGLVLGGPYRLIRHPLYLVEQIGVWGLMIQFAQPWALLVALASLAAQFPRMHYEEQILRKTFREYKDYEARTWRLIPHIY